MSNSTLNCQNLACPQPVIHVRDCIETEHPSTLQVIVDNKPAFENVSRLLTHYGYQVSHEEKSNIWHLTATIVTKNATNTPFAVKNESVPFTSSALTKNENECAKILVVISSSVMGQGDNTLGEKLMGTFVNTLPEMGEQLWRIILLNGGVKLVATQGTTLEGLKKLEEAGISVLVCGTCLEFFGLTDQKKVGETTNMLDVVTSLQLATQVIHI